MSHLTQIELTRIEEKVNEIDESLEKAIANKDFFIAALYDLSLDELRELSSRLKRLTEAANKEKREEEFLRVREEEEFWAEQNSE